MGFSILVRQEPGLLAPLLGKLTEETGPHCANKMVWWKISFDQPGLPIRPKLTGWVSDGPGTFHWLVRYGD